MQLNLPTTLTLVRIFLVPLLVVVLLTPPWTTNWVRQQVQEITTLHWVAEVTAWMSAWREIVAVAIFLVAAATDVLDGYLARSRKQVTTLGKLLDPIADKLLTTSAFISLVELKQAPAWMVVVIVGREFAVSGMRSIAAAQGLIIAASPWGKYKTASQVIAIPLLILTHTVETWARQVNLGKLQLAIVEVDLDRLLRYPGIAALWVVMALAIVSMVHYFVGFMRSVDVGAER